MDRADTSRLIADPCLDGSLLRRLWRCLSHWNAVARERHELTLLDDRSLRDIGLRREDAAQEACRPFWDTSGCR